MIAGLGMGGCAAGPGAVPSASPAEIPGLERSLALRPSDADAMVRLGAAYLEAERPGDALRVLDRAVSLRPDDPVPLALQGLAHEEQGAWEEAVARYAGALERNPPAQLERLVQARLAASRRQALAQGVRAALARESELADTPPDPMAVAVFPFQYGTGAPEYQPLARAFPALLVTGLAQVDRVRVLERARVQLLLDEIALGEAGLVDPATAARSGRLLGAGRIVQGRLDVSAAEALGVLASVVPVGVPGVDAIEPLEDEEVLRRFYELQERVLEGILASLGLTMTPEERERIRLGATENLEALLALGRALEAEDEGDFLGALEAFRESAALDPGFGEAGEGVARTTGITEVATGSGPGAGMGRPGALPGLPGPERDPGGDWGITASGGGGIPAGTSTPVERDPVQELLDRDRVGTRTAILEIILRRPGSGS
jgi:tetratricopeptide (TPR) repeat protein